MDLQEIGNKDGFYITANLVDTLPQTAANYGIFFTAIKPVEVMAVSIVFGTVSTSGTVTVEKLTGTTAKGSGTSILTAALSTAANASTVLNGVVSKVKTSSIVPSQLEIGDRLALKSGGTLTSGKDLQVTLYCKPRNKGDYK